MRLNVLFKSTACILIAAIGLPSLPVHANIRDSDCLAPPSAFPRQADSPRDEALNFLKDFRAKYGELFSKLAVRETLKIAGEFLNPPRMQELFEALSDRRFTMGQNDSIHVTPGIAEGFVHLTALPDKELHQATGMKREDWKIFLLALYARSKLRFFDEASLMPQSPKDDIQMERYRRLALAHMMLLLPVIAQGRGWHLSEVPDVSLHLAKPSDARRQMEEDKTGKPLDPNMRIYRLDWDSVLRVPGCRMTGIDLFAGDLKYNTVQITGAEFLQKLSQKIKDWDSLPARVSSAWATLRNKMASPEDGRKAGTLVGNHASPDMLQQIVEATFAESDPGVLAREFLAIMMLMEYAQSPSPEMFEQYGRLRDLAKGIRNEDVADELRKMARFVRHPYSQEMLLALLKNSTPKSRRSLITDLAKYPGDETASAIMASVQKDTQNAGHAMHLVLRMLPQLSTEGLHNLLDTKDGLFIRRIMEALATRNDNDAVVALSVLASEDSGYNQKIRDQAISALNNMINRDDLGSLTTEVKYSLLEIPGLSPEIHERVAQSEWHFPDAESFRRFVGVLLPKAEAAARPRLLAVVSAHVREFTEDRDAMGDVRHLVEYLKTNPSVQEEEALNAIAAILPEPVQEETEMASKLGELSQRDVVEIGTDDIRHLAELAARMIGSKTGDTLQKKLTLLLQRLAANKQAEWQTYWEELVRYGLTDRFGVLLEAANEALAQPGIAPEVWLISKWGSTQDGESTPKGFAYDPEKDALVQINNPTIYMERIPGTTRFMAPSDGDTLLRMFAEMGLISDPYSREHGRAKALDLLFPDLVDSIHLKDLIDTSSYTPGPYTYGEVLNLPEYKGSLEYKEKLFERECDKAIAQGLLSADKKDEVRATFKRLLRAFAAFKTKNGKVLYYDLTSVRADSATLRLIRLVLYGSMDLNERIQAAEDRTAAAANLIAARAFSGSALDRAIGALMASTGTEQKIEHLRLAVRMALYGSGPNIWFSDPAVQLDPEAAALKTRLLFEDAKALDLQPDHTKEFVREILESQRPMNVTYFVDDNGDLIYHLHLIQAYLSMNPDLTITVVGKKGRHAIDASVDDILSMLSRPEFGALRNYQGKQFLVLKDAPQLAGIDLQHISGELADNLRHADAVIAVGQTLMETLNGLKKTVFHQAYVDSRTHRTVTGLPRGALYFFKAEPGKKYFDAYNASAYRRIMENPAAGLSLVDTARLASMSVWSLSNAARAENEVELSL